MLVVLAHDLARAGAGTTNAPAKLSAPPDYASFRVVNDRNIFNASRSGPSRRAERRRPNRVDSFGLVGIMEYEKGRFAFFDGSSSEYRQTLKPNGTIAGHTVVDIQPDRVRLAYGTNQLAELRVGMQMRREEGGAWVVGDSDASFAGSDRDAAPRSSGATGRFEAVPSAELDEVVKRLMQQRERETQ